MTHAKLENLSFGEKASGEEAPCFVCGSSVSQLEVTENGFPIVRCLNCDMVFVNPRPTEEALDRFYAHYYPPESEKLWQRQMEKVFLAEGLAKIKKLVPAGRLLDVGCGYGYFLDLMQSAGWVVTGVEISKDAARFAGEKLGLDVRHGQIEDAALPSNSFDVVTLWYVLEHAREPHMLLHEVWRVIKEGGFLIIRVPNRNVDVDKVLASLGLGHFFLINPPRHLNDFSAKTLRLLLEKQGFDITEVKNSIPRETGSILELIRRHLWFWMSEALFRFTKGKIIRGSSITVYARKR